MAWLLLGKPDLSMILNGCLAGLVAITAGCAYVSVPSALADRRRSPGVLVVLAVLLFDRLRLDDPVGALSVHLVNGVFGTLAVGSSRTRASPRPSARTRPRCTTASLLGGGFAQLGSQALGAAAVARLRLRRRARASGSR